MRTIERLLAGEVPLRDAFWNWLVARGLPLNLACTLAAMALVATDPETATWQPWLAALLHLAAIPFNVVCLLGVWRATSPSAPGALAYRAAALALFTLYIFV